jgi:hypothetical protein
MCPLDDGYLDRLTWFPDEGVCPKRNAPSWVRRQRQIARKIAPLGVEGGLFILQMLKHECVLGSSFRGLDPNRPLEPQLKAWFKKHPPKRQPTDEERKAIRVRFEEARRG